MSQLNPISKTEHNYMKETAKMRITSIDWPIFKPYFLAHS